MSTDPAAANVLTLTPDEARLAIAQEIGYRFVGDDDGLTHVIAPSGELLTGLGMPNDEALAGLPNWLAPLETNGAAWQLAKALGADFIEVKNFGWGATEQDGSDMKQQFVVRWLDRKTGIAQTDCYENTSWAIAAAFLSWAKGQPVRIEEAKAEAGHE